MTDTLILQNNQAPGDALMMTCAIRDLHINYPNRFITAIATKQNDIFKNNPYITSVGVDRKNSRLIKLGYTSSINDSNTRCAHFSTGFTRDLSEKLVLPITPTSLRPDIHLLEAEKDRSCVGIKKPYWVVVAGGKSDFTNKVWDSAYYQEVVDSCPDTTFVQVGSTKDIHPPLKGVINKVGATNLREFMLLIAHSEGVICPITAAMHLAGAFNKPCIVIAGGREPFWWEAYTRNTWKASIPAVEPPKDFVEHAFVDSLGNYPCCKKAGCWKNGVGEKAQVSKNCTRVVKGPTRPQPECMAAITPETVIALINMYKSGKPVPTRELPDTLRKPLYKEQLAPVSYKLPATVAKPTPPLETPQIPKNLLDTRGKMRGRRRFLTRQEQRKLRRQRRQARPAPEIHMPQATYPRASPVTQVPAVAPAVRAASRLPRNLKKMYPQTIKGRVTICVLLYGDHPELAQRSLGSIYASTDPSCFQLRIGLNAVCDATREYINKEIVPYGNVVLFDSKENIFKYPMLRRMLWSKPEITTDWIIYFDDDSFVTEQDWLPGLYKTMQDRPSVSMLGKIYFAHVKQPQIDWMKTRPWWKDKPLPTRKGMPKVDFVTGGFWAIKTSVAKELDIPDPGLSHQGDIEIGAILYEGGIQLYQYYYGIKISAAPRRGVSQRRPGLGGGNC